MSHGASIIRLCKYNKIAAALQKFADYFYEIACKYIDKEIDNYRTITEKMQPSL